MVGKRWRMDEREERRGEERRGEERSKVSLSYPSGIYHA